MKDLCRAGAAFDCRDKNVCKRELFIHLDVGHVDKLQTRIAQLPDEHVREFLADTIRNALKPYFRWHLCLLAALEHVTDQLVADLDIVEVLEAYTAFKTRADFADILLFVAQGRHFALVHHVVAAVQSYFSITVQLAFRDAAACHPAQFRGGKDRQDAGPADHLLDHDGLEHALEGLLDILGHAVDDVVQPDGDALGIRQTPRCHIGLHVEADDDSLGCRRQHHVVFSDVARLCIEYLDPDLTLAELLELHHDRF